MVLIPAILGAASVLGAAINANTVSKAKKQQTALARETAGRVDAEIPRVANRLKPYTDVGGNAIRALGSEYGLNAAPEGFGGFKESPGYQYALSEGEEAINRAAASKGLRLSGGTQKDLTRHAVGTASQDYGNWRNGLAGLATNGQNAASTVNTQTANLESIRGNALTGASNAIGNAASAQLQNTSALVNNLAFTYGGYNNGLFDKGTPTTPANTGSRSSYKVPGNFKPTPSLNQGFNL